MYDSDTAPTDSPLQHDQPEDHPTRSTNVTAPIEAVLAAKAIPYGIYDMVANSGWVTIGTDHRTAAFAVFGGECCGP
ncbi:hypothetical protein PV367_23305 [Streptomyces europaeiscabiei]|uniref:Uncharacterized protein n=1 Tax=Streptomyces europaeiscabiei TaxID=146819 RepID=A0AAJ2UN79_9ACTN|nr:hypothetical protein [Streptomyces europaeiscabiei]MDX3132644.1 hypothetical protein [Streptomyces europaeiscabiei]